MIARDYSSVNNFTTNSMQQSLNGGCRRRPPQIENRM